MQREGSLVLTEGTGCLCSRAVTRGRGHGLRPVGRCLSLPVPSAAKWRQQPSSSGRCEDGGGCQPRTWDLVQGLAAPELGHC